MKTHKIALFLAPLLFLASCTPYSTPTVRIYHNGHVLDIVYPVIESELMDVEKYMTDAHPFLKDSADILQARIDNDPYNFDPVYQLGLKYLHDKNYDMAVRQFEEAVKRQPHNSEAHHAIFVSKFLSKFDVNDPPDFDEEFAAEIDSILVHEKLAIQYDPYFSREIDLYLMSDNLMKAEGGINNLISVALLNLYVGRYRESLIFFENLEGPTFKSTAFKEHIGLARGALGNYRAAELYFLELVEHTEKINNEGVFPVYINPADKYYVLAYTYWLHRKYSEAEKYFKLVIEKDMTFYMAHYYLGLIHNKNGFTGLAIKEMKRALTLAPDDPVLYYNLGEFYKKIKYYNDAVKSYITAIKKSPYYYMPHLGLASIYEETGNMDKAKEQYQYYLTKLPKTKTLMIENIKDKINNM